MKKKKREHFAENRRKTSEKKTKFNLEKLSLFHEKKTQLSTKMCKKNRKKKQIRKQAKKQATRESKIVKAK